MSPTRTVMIVLPLSAILAVSCSPQSASAPAALTGPDALRTSVSRDDEHAISGDARAEDAVRHADAAEVRAFLSNDPTSLARLWSDDFVVTNPFNQFVTKQQVLALVTSGVLAFSSYERHIEYMHGYGRVMIVAGSEIVVWAGRMPLAGQTSHLRYTAVWARHGDEWREVARHATLILPGSPGGPPLGS